MVFGPRLRQVLPYINFVVATSALAFQTTVLYPWHYQLEKQFHVLKGDQALMLGRYHDVKLQRLSELEQKIVGLESRIHVSSMPRCRSSLD
ncbi:hypothetical protein B0H10DRAFT_1816507 [Mycena sp. CBHHK59/15]|nr:hypothetical protein B0H10DRAFT_1816507 [Mycena sp. CBHHK59/15]